MKTESVESYLRNLSRFEVVVVVQDSPVATSAGCLSSSHHIELTKTHARLHNSHELEGWQLLSNPRSLKEVKGQLPADREVPGARMIFKF